MLILMSTIVPKGLISYLTGLIDALKRSALLSKEIGSMAVIVDALNKNIIKFYEKFDFIKFIDKNKLFLTMNSINKLSG